MGQAKGLCTIFGANSCKLRSQCSRCLAICTESSDEVLSSGHRPRLTQLCSLMLSLCSCSVSLPTSNTLSTWTNMWEASCQRKMRFQKIIWRKKCGPPLYPFSSFAPACCPVDSFTGQIRLMASNNLSLSCSIKNNCTPLSSVDHQSCNQIFVPFSWSMLEGCFSFHILLIVQDTESPPMLVFLIRLMPWKDLSRTWPRKAAVQRLTVRYFQARIIKLAPDCSCLLLFFMQIQDKAWHKFHLLVLLL